MAEEEKELTEEERKKAAGGVKADTGQLGGSAQIGKRPDSGRPEDERPDDDDKRGR